MESESEVDWKIWKIWKKEENPQIYSKLMYTTSMKKAMTKVTARMTTIQKPLAKKSKT